MTDLTAAAAATELTVDIGFLSAIIKGPAAGAGSTVDVNGDGSLMLPTVANVLAGMANGQFASLKDMSGDVVMTFGDALVSMASETRFVIGYSDPTNNLASGTAIGMLTIINDNSADTTINRLIYGASTPGGDEFYRARGTRAAPTAVQNGDAGVDFGARFHDGSGFGSSAAAIITQSTQTHAPGAHGARVSLESTANGSPARTKWGRLENSGAWTVTGFIGAGMTTLDSIENRQPATYLHAIGLSQANYGHMILQDDFHSSSSTSAFLNFIGNNDDGATASGRVGHIGYHGTADLQLVNLLTGSILLNSNGGGDVRVNVRGLGVAEDCVSGYKASFAGLFRTDGDSSGLQIFNTAGTEVGGIFPHKFWTGGGSAGDMAIGAHANLEFFAGANSVAGMTLNMSSELLIGVADQGAYLLQVGSQIYATNAAISTSDLRRKTVAAASKPFTFDGETVSAPLSDRLMEAVLAVPAIMYTRTDEECSRVQFGYGAQHWQNALAYAELDGGENGFRLVQTMKDGSYAVTDSDAHTLKIAALQWALNRVENRLAAAGL